MTVVQQDFPIECMGRNREGNVALIQPVNAVVNIHQRAGSNMISSTVKCPYNTGGHGQRCRASHPEHTEKVGDGVICPYSFDIPFALELKKS